MEYKQYEDAIKSAIVDNVTTQNSFIHEDGMSALPKIAEEIVGIGNAWWKYLIATEIRKLQEEQAPDSESNFGLNESYRLALGQIAERLGVSPERTDI